MKSAKPQRCRGLKPPAPLGKQVRKGVSQAPTSVTVFGSISGWFGYSAVSHRPALARVPAGSRARCQQPFLSLLLETHPCQEKLEKTELRTSPEGAESEMWSPGAACSGVVSSLLYSCEYLQVLLFYKMVNATVGVVHFPPHDSLKRISGSQAHNLIFSCYR